MGGARNRSDASLTKLAKACSGATDSKFMSVLSSRLTVLSIHKSVQGRGAKLYSGL